MSAKGFARERESAKPEKSACLALVITRTLAQYLGNDRYVSLILFTAFLYVFFIIESLMF
jgi:hypothetical protein